MAVKRRIAAKAGAKLDTPGISMLVSTIADCVTTVPVYGTCVMIASGYCAKTPNATHPAARIACGTHIVAGASCAPSKSAGS